PSGALIPNAWLTLAPADPAPSQPSASLTRSDAVGRFLLTPAPGAYTLTVRASGFADLQLPPFHLAAGDAQVLDVHLAIAPQMEEIEVRDDPAAARAAGALVLSQPDIDQLPLDPTALLDQLQTIAGTSAAQLCIDGLSAVSLPPRSQIREIRINQNPYSAQNDIGPATGSIQILTRPGTDRLHADLYVLGNLSQLNAKDPFLPGQPSYYAVSSEGTLSGALRRDASFILRYAGTEERLNSLIDAQALAASAQTLPPVLASPFSRLVLSPRLDLRSGPHGTLILAYTLQRTRQTDGGVGQTVLPSQAYTNTTLTHTLQISNTQVLGDRAIDETRLQYLRQDTAQTPASDAQTIVVQGVFQGGGSPDGDRDETLTRLEAQNYLTLSHRAHYTSLGARLRTARVQSRSTAGFNGTFVFSSLADYTNTVYGTAHAAAQYLKSIGDPAASVSLTDAALFAHDDWKAASRLTLSYGLRAEIESFASTRLELAPRTGFSLALGRANSGATPRYTLHGGAGIFFRRFPLDSALTAVRQSGATEKQLLIPSPQFFTAIPDDQSLQALSNTTTYRVSPRFRTPYTFATTLSLDRQLGRSGTLGLSWLLSRGIHTPLLENTNAPLPGTYNPGSPAGGVRPLGTDANLYDFASDGLSRSNRLSAILNLRHGKYSLYTYYMARFNTSDAEANAFASQPYTVAADRGRADDDIRHSFTLRAAAELPHHLSLSGFVHATSGAPFNIVLPTDRNGDSRFNDRPAFATDRTRATVVLTSWGAFDTDPQPGQTIIPRNLGQAPAYVLVDFAAGRSFILQREAKRHTAAAASPNRAAPNRASPSNSSPRAPASLTLWVEAQNLFNHPNHTTPVGTLGSPLFGRSLAIVRSSSLSGDRTVNLQLSLRF
ncbi:MAG: carboxypeptidase regulatory-like domain-containing protein, partial [Acidobacteriota bacterium]|nr:carboxypeptidase regulatory-like domain-containing protein [Acidobacteriota bacterium]